MYYSPLQDMAFILAAPVAFMTCFISLVLYSRSVLSVLALVAGYCLFGFYLASVHGGLLTLCWALLGMVVAAVYGVATDDESSFGD